MLARRALARSSLSPPSLSSSLPSSSSRAPLSPFLPAARPRLRAMANWDCEYVPDAAAGGAADAPAFRAALARFRAAKPAPHFVVFTSDRDSDNNYWCPDCVTALPAVLRAAETAGASLLEVGVGGRAAWRGNAVHAFRQAPLSVSGVPTLVRLAEDGATVVAARMGPELEAAGSAEAAGKLAAAFFSAVR
jgi:hypothetical protein